MAHDPPPQIRSISQVELFWLWGAVLFGLILRLSFPTRMAIEHFDEGVYASNIWFGFNQGGEYPSRHLYAPPLLPMAIEWTMIVASLCGIQPTGFIPMIPCLIAGLATIPSIWWIGRRWFGPSAGIVAAWFVATSDFHACYSRAALTDVPVCLFILWGVYFICQSLQTGTLRHSLLAGLFTGLAWWTKYNGWLPLLIGLFGGMAWQISGPRHERCLRLAATRWLSVAAIAFAIWSPVLWGLQSHGGYSAVAANHRQYVVGFRGWGMAALQQLTNIGLYDNWFSLLTEPWLLPTPQTVETNKTIHQPDRLNKIWVIATPLVFLLVSGVTYASLLIRKWSELRNAGVWTSLAWFAGMSLSTPLYHPYPRLALPWLIGCWIGVALSLQMLRNPRFVLRLDKSGSNALWTPARVELVVIGWLVVCESTRCGLGTAHAWADRTHVASMGTQIASKIQELTKNSGFPPEESIIYVFGEPAMAFTLKSRGFPLVVPIQHLRFLSSSHPRPVFFVYSDRALKSATFQEELMRHRNDFEIIETQNLKKSPLVLFDDSDTSGNQRINQDIPANVSVWIGRVTR